MNIILSTGAGAGPTARAAYHAALLDAGVRNYNMIGLSSAIPPRSRIFRQKYRTPAGDYGKRLYVVTSQMSQALAGQWAHAALGWLQDAASGRGLFIELHNDNLESLQHDMRATAQAMRCHEETAFAPVQSEIASIPCRHEPVCALAIAVYTGRL